MTIILSTEERKRLANAWHHAQKYNSDIVSDNLSAQFKKNLEHAITNGHMADDFINLVLNKNINLGYILTGSGNPLKA